MDGVNTGKSVNGHKKIAALFQNEEIPGQLYSAYSDLRRGQSEYTSTEGDVEEGGHIITRVWGAVTEEDCSERTVHTNIKLFFADDDNKCQQ